MRQPRVEILHFDGCPNHEAARGLVFSCRVYRSDRGFSRQPDARWVREALSKAAA
jgi:hypothetical protein